MNIKTKRMVLIVIAAVLAIVGTVSYAYFSAVGEFQNQTVTLSTGTARVTFRDGDTGMTGELSFGESITKKFTIENTGTVEANVKMYFKDLINTYGVGSLTYTLLQTETEDGTYTEIVNKTDVPRSSRPSKKRLVDQLTIPVGKTYFYELVITLNYLPDVNQDADINARFSSTFEIEDINEPEAPLPELMAVTNSYNEKLWAHRDTIKRIIFETTETLRENAAYTYDLSESQDGSIMSYLYPDEEDNTKYIAYIQSEEGIKANVNSGYLFYGFKILEQIDNLYYLDTSNVTNMGYMFSNCSSLTSLDLSNFNTGNVTNMLRLFSGCTKLTSLDINNFDTSNVTNMSYVFSNCNSLASLELSNFDTSNVTSISYMFYNCSNLTSLDVSKFDTGKVKTMQYMFYNCSHLTYLDVGNFDTSKVTTMQSMFESCSKITSLDVSNFNTNNVTTMKDMFRCCRNIISLDINNFNTSKVTDMSYMFFECRSIISLDLSNFNTSVVTTMESMFNMNGGTSKLTSLNLSSFDTSNVTNMESMFNYCSSLIILDLSNFNTSIVKNMNYMFIGCKNLTTLNLKNWNVSKVTKYTNIFFFVPSTIQISVSNSTMRQWVIDKSDSPKLTTNNVII